MDTRPGISPPTSAVRPYPWNALSPVPREAAGLLRDARRAVARAVDESKLADALSELVGDRASLRVSLVEVISRELAPLDGVSVALGTADDAVRIDVEVERELARALVARTLARPAKLGDPRAPIPPEIEGALLAIVHRLARRAHGSAEVLRPRGRGGWRLSPGDRRIEVHATVTLGGEAYAARASVQLRSAAVVEPRDPAELLASLAGLPISLPLVVAVSAVCAAEVYSLERGDVWMPGGGWSARRDCRIGTEGGSESSLVGEAMLAPPGADRGIAVKLGEAGQIVVLGVRAVPHDVETMMSSKHPLGGVGAGFAPPPGGVGAGFAPPPDETTATSDVVLEAPLVMRVEMGSVTLGAREWAALTPGDVIALGRRVNEPVILRIAGAEVARGELVDIEGELGVRIRERARAT